MHATFGGNIQPERPLAQHKNIKILIVEDEKIVAWDIRETLREAGIRRVAMAHTLREARRVLQRHPRIALVFLDLKLPDGDGNELLIELDALRISTIIVTGYSAIEAKGRPVLHKPYDTEDVVRIAARVLGSR